MNRLDPNALIIPACIIILAMLAVTSGYRLEISKSGLRFETNVTAVRRACDDGRC
jgi:hypothetical protein